MTAFIYRNKAGKIIYRKVRQQGKDFFIESPDGKGGWLPGLKSDPTIYHAPEVDKAIRSGEIIFFVEGEKDAENLTALGFCSTTSGSATSWKPEFAKYYKGLDVVILPDNDEAGRKYALDVANSIYPFIKSLKVINLPGLKEKQDVSDWLESGHTKDDLLKLASNAPWWQPETQIAITSDSWPSPVSKEAMHGLVGEIVRIIEPHTEADQISLISQFLTAFGNVINKGGYFTAEADRHGTNLFITLVGETAKGRKGTSWGHIKRLFKAIDDDWTSSRIASGLSSGEGLIWAVRDPIEKEEPIKENGHVVEYQTVVVDPGVEDKRLLVLESELSSVLKVLRREGNTLSAIIRNSWDSGNLRTLTKNSPATATGAHISIIGHITKDELLRYLDDVETGNGFANRFLWLCVKRSKCLPEGGNLSESDLEPLLIRLKEAIEFAQNAGELKRDDEAKQIWHKVYPELSEGKPGLVGSITARAEAQVMRLACIYALLDCSNVIKKEHLNAALALWEYCEDSAKHIFGNSIGDPIADTILKALKESPLSRTDISSLFSRNLKATRLNQALTLLQDMNLAHCESEQSNGRSVEKWFINVTN